MGVKHINKYIYLSGKDFLRMMQKCMKKKTFDTLDDIKVKKFY